MSSLSNPSPPPPPLPAPLEQWLALNLEFRVVVCHAPECHQALSPKSISRHLRDRHQAKREVQKQADAYIQRCAWVYDFQTVPLPPDASPPQPILPVLPGFQCVQCRFASRSRHNLRNHGRQEHLCDKRLPDAQLFRAVQLQTWFTEKRARYWVVDVDATRVARDSNKGGGEGRSGSCRGSDDDASAAIRAEITEWMGREDEEAPYRVSTVAMEVDPWLQYMGWEEVLAGSKHGLIETAAFAATATAEEAGLAIVMESWERLLLRSLGTLAALGDYKDVLKWWASPKVEAASQRPFERPRPQTIARYSQTFARLLCYVFRTATGSGDEPTETGVTYSVAQRREIGKVRRAVAVPDNDAQIDSALMGVIISLLGQDMSQVRLYESPVMHYMAVRSIDLETASFSPSFRYTPLLAHMIWIIRLLFLELTVPEHAWPEYTLQSREQLGAEAGAVAESIQKARKNYLCEGSFSPASSILSQLAFGQRLNRVQSSDANIYWSDDRHTVFFDGKGVAMAKVQGMCRALVTELEELLHDLLFGEAVPPVPLPQLVDSMGMAQRFQQQKYSFLDHPDNAPWKIGWQFLWDQMLRNGQTLVVSSSRGSHGHGQLAWADQPRKAYLTREKQFLLKLMVAMHLTGGQPARSPEIGSIKLRNSATSSRNLFIINGRVAVVTTYDKARQRRGRTEYVFRCFPDQLSQVIAQYLVYVLPFTRAMQKTKGDYLFATEQEPWIGDQLTGAVALATTKHLGVRLTMSSWRQVAIAISNEYLRKASRIWKQDQGQDQDGVAVDSESDGEAEQNIFDQILVRQSGHGQRTAEMHYAIDGAFLNRLGPDLVNSFSQASRAWHAFLQLESQGAAVAAALPATKRPISQARLIPNVNKRPRITTTTTTPTTTAMQGLQKLLGPDGQPKSQGQAHALELVHAATASQPQIIVLGTGSGKSLLFFSVAAMVSPQTVIVVVPFAALVDDLVARARRHQLTCEEWHWQRPWRLLPQLLIVSADRAVEGDFLHFAKGLELNKQLAHVFFDECHVAVTDTSYRARLRELWQLRYLDCRFTCLTATLPTCLEPVLCANLLLERAAVYRQSTMRPEIRYRVIDCQAVGIWASGLVLIRKLPLPSGSRGIIYVRSYADGERVVEEIGCPFYQATATDKQVILDQWARGSGGWIVATGALGTGVNIAGVLHVVHLGRPYGAISFVQQSGRGGREGMISNSIVVAGSSSNSDGGGSGRGSSDGDGDGDGDNQRIFPAMHQSLLNTYSVEAEDEAILTRFLESSTCRRAVLAAAFDGHATGTDCFATRSVLCDNCLEVQEAADRGSGRGQSPAVGSPDVSLSPLMPEPGRGGRGSQPPPNSDLIHQALQSEVEQNEQLESFHRELHPYCIYCALILESHDSSHCHGDCPKASEKGCDIDSYRRWRARLRLATRHQCFRCGLSQSICTAIEDGISCTYPHLMLPALFFLHQVGYLLTLCQELGFQGGEADQQWQWLNREGERMFGQREVNWIRVWRRVGETWQGAWEL